MQSRLAAMQAVVFSRNLLITVQNISLEKLGVCFVEFLFRIWNRMIKIWVLESAWWVIRDDSGVWIKYVWPQPYFLNEKYMSYELLFTISELCLQSSVVSCENILHKTFKSEWIIVIASCQCFLVGLLGQMALRIWNCKSGLESHALSDLFCSLCSIKLTLIVQYSSVLFIKCPFTTEIMQVSTSVVQGGGTRPCIGPVQGKVTKSPYVISQITSRIFYLHISCRIVDFT